MEPRVGDKVVAYVVSVDHQAEIVTTIIDEVIDYYLVEWDKGIDWDNNGICAWWIYKDMTLPKEKVRGHGKVICKNWRRYKRSK